MIFEVLSAAVATMTKEVVPAAKVIGADEASALFPLMVKTDKAELEEAATKTDAE